MAKDTAQKPPTWPHPLVCAARGDGRPGSGFKRSAALRTLLCARQHGGQQRGMHGAASPAPPPTAAHSPSPSCSPSCLSNPHKQSPPGRCSWRIRCRVGHPRCLHSAMWRGTQRVGVACQVSWAARSLWRGAARSPCCPPFCAQLWPSAARPPLPTRHTPAPLSPRSTTTRTRYRHERGVVNHQVQQVACPAAPQPVRGVVLVHLGRWVRRRGAGREGVERAAEQQAWAGVCGAAQGCDGRSESAQPHPRPAAAPSWLRQRRGGAAAAPRRRRRAASAGRPRPAWGRHRSSPPRHQTQAWQT